MILLQMTSFYTLLDENNDLTYRTIEDWQLQHYLFLREKTDLNQRHAAHTENGQK